MYFKIKDKEKITNYYKKNGYVIIRNFFLKKRIHSIKKKILKDIKIKKNNFFYYEKVSNGTQKLRRIEKISDFCLDAKKIIYSKKITKFINLITNNKNKLFKDKLNFKYPDGEGYLHHIDGHFYWRDNKNIRRPGWKVYSNSFINFVMALEKSNISNGCLYVSNKNNIKKLGNNWKDITNKLDSFTPNIKNKDLKKFSYKPTVLDVGDILLFDWHCAHKSSKNLSSKSRMIFYATYCANNKRFKNVRKKYYLDKKYIKNNSKIKSLQFN